MVKVCKNAYGHFIRSRPSPAPESVKRVKDLEKAGHKTGLHPIYGMRGCVHNVLDILISIRSIQLNPIFIYV